MIVMESMKLIWFNAGDDSHECSFCHGQIDSLIIPVVVQNTESGELARFHPNCYESYFYSASRNGQLADRVDWVEPAIKRFSKW
jgi:hypothetical protein